MLTLLSLSIEKNIMLNENIYFKKNQKRKAQRVKTPLSFIFNNKTYKTFDWSITGVSILVNDLDEEDSPFIINQSYKIQLVIPIGENSIVLPLTVICMNIIESKKIGFEFSELSISNKRILRHYIGLYIDEKLDNIEDIIRNLSTIKMESPINNFIMLSCEEHDKFKKNTFKTHKYIYNFSCSFICGIFVFTCLSISSFGNIKNLKLHQRG